MLNLNFTSLERDDLFLTQLDHNVWLMDNHKWALHVWEQHRSQSTSKNFVLAHADYHWDAGYDFWEAPDVEGAMLGADLDQLRGFIESEEPEWIRYDSFIGPAVARGTVRELHFFCLQGDSMGDVAFTTEFLDRFDVSQQLHETPESFAAIDVDRPLIFDICLDLFNRATDFRKGDLWPDDEVWRFLDTVRPLVEHAEVVTISLSFDCSGTVADTRHLASLVIPRIDTIRESSQQLRAS